MIMRNALVCYDCGHKGDLVRDENDQAFTRSYEEFYLQGFDGKRLDFSGGKEPPSDILAALNPSCPECGSNDIRRAPELDRTR